MTGRKTEESGQSLVECAIILPLLVLVMSVVIVCRSLRLAVCQQLEILENDSQSAA